MDLNEKQIVVHAPPARIASLKFLDVTLLRRNYMHVKTITAILALFFLNHGLGWTSEKIQLIPEFSGGINASNIIACEKNYKRTDCPLCVDKKMLKDKQCVQANKIRELTAHPPTKIKTYGPVTVFNITTLADGQDLFYMVDIQGRLIPLTTDVELNKNEIYLQLKKKYPNIALMPLLYWTKMHENLFPYARTLPNKNQRLIFKQTLRDRDCVACPTVGVAFIAYEFNDKGEYLRSLLVKVESSHS